MITTIIHINNHFSVEMLKTNVTPCQRQTAGTEFTSAIMFANQHDGYSL